MKRSLKTNQRKKLLNRQHNKMSSRRLSHFNLSLSAVSTVQQAESER
ncbi:hypothetical protein [Colwellia echini]|nr:hypothetical protein [Colwellia echini]